MDSKYGKWPVIADYCLYVNNKDNKVYLSIVSESADLDWPDDILISDELDKKEIYEKFEPLILKLITKHAKELLKWPANPDLNI